ncbi:MAG TPA: DUF84 family protein [Patescibacteria group bacterium]
MIKRHLEVVVASKSEQKLEPTRVVFRGRRFRKYDITVRGVAAKSGINEQPIGDIETEIGARTRLHHAKELAPLADVWIGMESGIRDVVTRRGTKHEDFAFVISQDRNAHSGVATTSAVEFPDNAYQEAKRRGFDTTTVGSVIAEMTGCDGTDPHSYLTDGKKPRKKLLERAIRQAVKQLPL